MRRRTTWTKRRRNSGQRCRSIRVLRRAQSTLLTCIACRIGRRRERVLKDALSRSPDDPSLDEALGLLMVRQKRGAQALELLGDAVRGEPDNARYAYVYAIALNDTGKTPARDRYPREFYQGASVRPRFTCRPGEFPGTIRRSQQGADLRESPRGNWSQTIRRYARC